MERVEEKRESFVKEDYQGTYKINLQQKDVGVKSVNKGVDKNFYGQKRFFIKNFIQYVLDTDFVKLSYIDSEGNSMDRNGGFCLDFEMFCRMERKMGLFRVIFLLCNKFQENYRLGKR